MDIQKSNNYFIETQDAINKIKKLIPKLNESERETLELLLDGEARSLLERSAKEVKEGKVISLDKFKGK